MSWAIAMCTIFPLPRGAPAPGTTGRRCRCMGACCWTCRAWTRLNPSAADGVAVCQPGVRLGVLEAEARKVGWELRCYPSTVAKASVGGFLGGGSGGIGSVAHGGLRDFATVRAMDVVTMEDAPRVVHHEGEAVHEILHAWGTNGIITRIWLALTPSVEWAQCSVAFDTFDQAFDFSERIATGAEWTKRLVTPFEWPIPSFFSPVRTLAPGGQGADIFHDCRGATGEAGSGGSGGGRGRDLLRALCRVAQCAAALRLHLEPHHACGP